MPPPPKWKPNVRHPRSNWGRWPLLPQKDSMSCGPTCAGMAMAWHTGQQIPPSTLTRIAKESGGYKLSTSDRVGMVSIMHDPNETIGGVCNAADLHQVAQKFANWSSGISLNTWQVSDFWPTRPALRKLMVKTPTKKSGRKTKLSVILGLVSPGHYIVMHSRRSRLGKKTEWYIADPDNGEFLAGYVYSAKWADLSEPMKNAMRDFGEAIDQTKEFPRLRAWNPANPGVNIYDTVVGESILVRFTI